MSLYNMLFGMNPHTDLVLSLLGLRSYDVERFRDCGLDLEAGRIWIYARTGGNNREDYPQDRLVSHPCHIEDVDDDFDNTYATFFFKIPDDMAPHVGALKDPSEHGFPAPIIKRFREVMARQSEADKIAALRDRHAAICKNLRLSGQAVQLNGWCFFPLTSSAVGGILDAVERDGAWYGDNVVFKRLTAKRDVVPWKGEIKWVSLEAEGKWEHDADIWAACRELFAEKYPKAIAFFQKKVDGKE